MALTYPYRHSILWGSASEVTSLCWRPDGKLLAVGHEDGSIALMDLEVTLAHLLPPSQSFFWLHTKSNLRICLERTRCHPFTIL